MGSMWLAVCVFVSAYLVGCNCAPVVPTPVPEDAAERYADALCHAAGRCGCVEELFAGGVEECEAERIEAFETVAAWPGVKFDPDCLESVFDRFEDDDCRTIGEYFDPASSQSARCQVFAGTLATGASCSPSNHEVANNEIAAGPVGGGLTFGPCSHPGFCHAGKCLRGGQQPLAVAGEPCPLSKGVSCDFESYCGRDGVCHPYLEPGAACDVPDACRTADDRGYCAGSIEGSQEGGTCRPGVDIGESCDARDVGPCDGDSGFSSFYCRADGVCARWPAVCTFVAATPGLYHPIDWIPD